MFQFWCLSIQLYRKNQKEMPCWDTLEFLRCLYSSTNFASALSVKKTDVRLNNLSSFLKCVKCKRQGFISLQWSPPGKPTLSTCQLHILIFVMLTDVGAFLCYYVAHSLNIPLTCIYADIKKKTLALSYTQSALGSCLALGSSTTCDLCAHCSVLTSMIIVAWYWKDRIYVLASQSCSG